jgi:hypothetical protein
LMRLARPLFYSNTSSFGIGGASGNEGPGLS